MPTPSPLARYLTLTAAVIWALWVAGDYLSVQERWLDDALAFPYGGLVLIYLVAAGGVAYFAGKRIAAAPEKTWSFRYRGIGAYGAVLLTAVLALAAFALNDRLPEASLGGRIVYFSGYASLHVGGLFLLAVSAFGWGNAVLRMVPPRSKPRSPLIAIALGISILGTLFTLIALMNALTLVVAWIPVVVGIGVGYRAVPNFVVDALWSGKSLVFRRAWAPAVLVLLLGVLGVSFLGAFKAFPIGYDGAALYLNRAMLTADSGGLTFGGQAFAWSVFMGAGEVLFGSAPMSILLSHLMAVPCLLLLYRIAVRWLSPGMALLVCLLTATAPFFAFHALVDEKVDLGFTFLAMATITLALDRRQDRPWWVIGWLLGYAFTIKYTALILALALGVFWLYERAGKWAFTGGVLAGTGFLFAAGIHRLGYIELAGGEAVPFGLALLLTGLGLIGYAYRDRLPEGLQLGKGLAIVAGTFLLAFAPWGVKHASEHGSLSVGHLIEGRSLEPPLEYLHRLSERSYDSPGPFYFTSPYPSGRPLEAGFTDYQPEAQDPAAAEAGLPVNQGAREDVQRYFGYEAAFWRYLSLPYDISVNSNLGGARFTNFGYLGLLLLPLLLLLPPTTGHLRPLRLLWLPVVAFYLVGVATTSSARQEDPDFSRGWEGSLSGPIEALGGLPVWSVIVAVLLIGLSATLAPRARLASLPRSVRSLGAFLSAYALFYWIMGNGVIWYAMPLFLLAPVFLCWFFDHPERFLGAASRTFSGVFFAGAAGLLLLLQFATYFTSPFEAENDPGGLFRYPFVEMATRSTINERKVQAYFNPASNEILDVLNGSPEAKVYRVGTQLGHFISDNDRRVFSDPVLERYAEIRDRLLPGEEEKFFDMLRAQGYRFILLDLRLGNVDRTPEQTLKNKFLSLATALFSSKKVRVLSTDNFVADPQAPPVNLPNGQRVNARRGLSGKTVSVGTVILFELL